MKIIKRIKAFFCKDDNPVELDLVAAEIKEGRAFLHTKEEPEITYMIRSDDIRISFSEGKSLSDADILSVSRKKKPSDPASLHENVNTQKQPQFSFPGFERYKKRVFSVSLYPEEYDSLINNMKEYGYKRADFLLACVQCAKKPSMEKAHKAIIKTHKQMLEEQKELIAQQIADLEKESPAV